MMEGVRRYSENDKIAFRKANGIFAITSVGATLLLLILCFFLARDSKEALVVPGLFAFIFIFHYMFFRFSFRYWESYRRRMVAYYVNKKFGLRNIDILGIIIAGFISLVVLLLIDLR